MKKGTIAVLAMTAGTVIGGATTKLFPKAQKEDKVYKFKSYYYVTAQWLKLKQEGKKIESYFIENGYKTIAIYGMGELGNCLYNDLKESSVEVKYAIDENSIYSDIEVCTLDDKLEKVDAIVVTPIFAFDKIQENIEKVFDGDIVSIEDIIYES